MILSRVAFVHLRCEVSAEAPLFNTVAQTKMLKVIGRIITNTTTININQYSYPALPQSPPLLSGTQPLYYLPQQVSVNCTSGSSYPAPHLSWKVNGQSASPHHLTHYPTIQHKSGLQTAILGIQFSLDKLQLVGPSLSLDLVCTSTMAEQVTDPTNTSKLMVVRHREVAKHMAKVSTYQAGKYKANVI